MSSQKRSSPRSISSGVARLALLGATLSLTGCSSGSLDHWKRGGLPEGITNQTDRITTLWQGAWIALLLVGIFVWGLILWAPLAFHRRRGETGLPPQVRYNVPVEVAYTVVPLILVLVFFSFTARDESAIAAVSGHADHKITVVGKRWSWDFNYTEGNVKVYDTGMPDTTPNHETDADRSGLPTLWLPKGESVEFLIEARDVAHSFWIPEFQYKIDALPGRINRFEVTPTKEGDYIGRCAELCGVDHSKMLFNVKVVTPQDYQAHIQDLQRRGQTGDLSVQLGPNIDQDTGLDSKTGERGSDR